MTTGKSTSDPALSKQALDLAVRTLWRNVRIVRDYWVPLLGGSARNWQTPVVYFDVRFRNELLVGGRVMQPYRYVLIHECVERTMMDELHLPYDVAHTFATAAERSAVEADGFSWPAYTAALQPILKLARTKPQSYDVPPDLDQRPYGAHS